MREFDFLTWEEMASGEYIESAEISSDIMARMDNDIESIMEELKNEKS